MNAKDFVTEFNHEDFPQQYGRWISFDDHEPPFTLGQLNRMNIMGVIELETVNRRYRLTMKATAICQSL